MIGPLEEIDQRFDKLEDRMKNLEDYVNEVEISKNLVRTHVQELDDEIHQPKKKFRLPKIIGGRVCW